MSAHMIFNMLIARKEIFCARLAFGERYYWMHTLITVVILLHRNRANGLWCTMQAYREHSIDGSKYSWIKPSQRDMFGMEECSWEMLIMMLVTNIGEICISFFEQMCIYTCVPFIRNIYVLDGIADMRRRHPGMNKNWTLYCIHLLICV